MTRYAAIFDMDGTLIDNNAYHFKAWQELFKKYGKPAITRQTYNESISGVPALLTLKKYFGEEHDEQDLKSLQQEKNNLYMQLYQPHIKAISGLEQLLGDLKRAGWKIAMASSSVQGNIDFLFNHVPVKQYFDVIVNGTEVSQPKPHPQIFLKAAENLQVRPDSCLVFEDSVLGMQAAHGAGMRVVGITTTHPAGEMHQVNLSVSDYTGLTAQKLSALFDK